MFQRPKQIDAEILFVYLKEIIAVLYPDNVNKYMEQLNKHRKTLADKGNFFPLDSFITSILTTAEQSAIFQNLRNKVEFIKDNKKDIFAKFLQDNYEGPRLG